MSASKVFFFVVITCILFFYANANGQISPSKQDQAIDEVMDEKNDKNPAQDSIVYTIDQIIITGNKQTKDHIITREMILLPGQKDTLFNLMQIIPEEENKIFNLRLFLQVKISLKIKTNRRVDVLVDVKERWYFYPIPILEVQARNINDWIENFGADLSRLKYGVKLTRYNARGRNERYRIFLKAGFSRLASLSYNFPSINKKQNLGLFFELNYTENNSVFFDLIESKQKFISQESPFLTKFNLFSSITYRQDFYATHGLGIAFDSYNISDSLRQINPNYVNINSDKSQLLKLIYSYQYDRRNRKNYALSGNYISFNITQIGLGLVGDYMQTEANFNYTHYTMLGKGFYFSGRVGTNFSYPKRQAFLFNQAIGFKQDLLRGFELYAINGESFLLHKFNLKKKIWATKVNIKSIINIPQFSVAPIDLYAKVFFDGGYVLNEEIEGNKRSLVNTYIRSLGIGVDFVSFYDFVVRLEFSRNSLQESNFAINLKADLFY